MTSHKFDNTQISSTECKSLGFDYRQVIEGDIYEIVPPEDENNNVIEVASGSGREYLQERTFWARIREPICTLRAQLLK